MDSGKLNDWVQIAATIGVIVGLILVAYEIRVSNRLGFEQANAERMDKWSSLSEVALSSDVTELHIRAMEGDELSRVELLKLHHFESIVLQTLFYEWTLAETGTVDLPGGFGSFYRGVIQSYLGYETFRRRWQSLVTYYRPEFAKEIDSALEAPNQIDFIGEIDFSRGVTDRIE